MWWGDWAPDQRAADARALVFETPVLEAPRRLLRGVGWLLGATVVLGLASVVILWQLAKLKPPGDLST